MENSFKCAICSRNLNAGIGILGKFVCDECEEVLVNLDIEDHSYDVYKELIKKNIYGDLILK